MDIQMGLGELCLRVSLLCSVPSCSELLCFLIKLFMSLWLHQLKSRRVLYLPTVFTGGCNKTKPLSAVFIVLIRVPFFDEETKPCGESN